MSGSSRSRSQAYGSSTAPVGRSHVCGLVGATGGSGRDVVSVMARRHGSWAGTVRGLHARVDRPGPVHRRRPVRRPLPRRVHPARGRHRLRHRGRRAAERPGRLGLAGAGAGAPGASRSSTPPRRARGSASSSRSTRRPTPSSTSASTAASPPAWNCAPTPPDRRSRSGALAQSARSGFTGAEPPWNCYMAVVQIPLEERQP